MAAVSTRNLHRLGHLVKSRGVTSSRLSSLNPSLSISLPNLVTSSPPATNANGVARDWGTPNLTRRNMATTTPTGAILDEPKKHPRFGLLKAFFTVMTGLSIGAWISQKMAAFLEENELFVPDDDDDDDDDD